MVHSQILFKTTELKSSHQQYHTPGRNVGIKNVFSCITLFLILFLCIFVLLTVSSKYIFTCSSIYTKSPLKWNLYFVLWKGSIWRDSDAAVHLNMENHKGMFHDWLKLSSNPQQTHCASLLCTLTKLSVKPVCPVDFNSHGEDWKSRGDAVNLKEKSSFQLMYEIFAIHLDTRKRDMTSMIKLQSFIET